MGASSFETGDTGGVELERLALRYELACAYAHGPTPVPEALELCESICRQPPYDGRADASPREALALLLAMHGEIDKARRTLQPVEERALELGLVVQAAGCGVFGARIEQLACDHVRAERQLRPHYETLAARADRGVFLDVVALLSRILYELGQLEEAHELSAVAERTEAAHDLRPQIEWRGARAKILASWGRIEDGEELARDALRLAHTTDWVNTIGEAWLDLSEVLRLARRRQEAAAAAAEALGWHDRKQNLPAAASARARLDELDARRRPAPRRIADPNGSAVTPR